MDSDFFTDDYAQKKELGDIEERLRELEDELTAGYEQTGRPHSYVREEIARLSERKEVILLELEDDEKKASN